MSSGPLTQEDLQTVLREFLDEQGKEFALVSLGYFGSYARQEAKPDSDVDIVFETLRPNLFATMRLHAALSDRFDRPVDLVCLHQYLSLNFRERIQREAIYV
jgi:uncharacterized protein